MVERIMRNPAVEEIAESEIAPPPLPRRGNCMICGNWVDADEGDDAVAAALDHGGNVIERVAHAACLARVAHPSAGLSELLAGSSEGVPDNYLASKFRTPSGR